MCSANSGSIEELRKSLRLQIWRFMEEHNIAAFPRPVYGRIPNFVGAEEAAAKILNLEEFKRASVVKVNPDAPQRPVRKLVLKRGKLLLMPTPRISRGFLLLDPKKIPPHMIDYASTISGAFRFGRVLTLDELPHVDLIVAGSVAVDIYGGRLGKGEGYSELEYGVLAELGKVDPDVVIVTTVHDVQVVNTEIPLMPWDFTVDYILTPTRSIKTIGEKRRPRGILWEFLSEDKAASIPVLRELRKVKFRK